MLTDLFCDYSPDIARHRPALSALAASFAQGLQMTNILKDVWEDRSRGACWLPQDVFTRHGIDLAQVVERTPRPALQRRLSTNWSASRMRICAMRWITRC